MRIQVLPLPLVTREDGQHEEPFALIIDQYNGPYGRRTGFIDAAEQFRDDCGARSVLVTEETVEVVAPRLPLLAGVPGQVEPGEDDEPGTGRYSLKMMIETLSIAQARIAESPLDRHRTAADVDRLQHLINQYERMRGEPVNPGSLAEPPELTPHQLRQARHGFMGAPSDPDGLDGFADRAIILGHAIQRLRADWHDADEDHRHNLRGIVEAAARRLVSQ